MLRESSISRNGPSQLGAKPLVDGRHAVPQSAPSLVLTDYLVLFSLVLIFMWALDPFAASLDLIRIIKHFPMIILAGALLFLGVGRKLFPLRPNRIDLALGEFLIAIWPLLVFGVIVLAGSLYARFVAGITNTFLNMALALFAMPLIAWAVAGSPNPLRLARIVLLLLAIFAAWAGVLQIANWADPGYFHSREFLVIPIAVYFAYASLPGLIRVAMVVFFLGLSWAAHKNTAYLVAFFVLTLLAFWEIRGRYVTTRDSLHKAFYVMFGALAGICAAGLVVVAYVFRDDLLPSGNPEFRLYTYGKAWAKFLESPIAGNAFTGAGSEYFDLYRVEAASNVLPTHSDPMDILANGGVVMSLLFLAGVWRIASRGLRFLTREQLSGNPAWGVVCCLFAIFVAGLITLSFNPVLYAPNPALSFWLAAGVMMGLIAFADSEQHAGGAGSGHSDPRKRS